LAEARLAAIGRRVEVHAVEGATAFRMLMCRWLGCSG
jgi:hypothetical protein